MVVFKHLNPFLKNKYVYGFSQMLFTTFDTSPPFEGFLTPILGFYKLFKGRFKNKTRLFILT